MHTATGANEKSTHVHPIGRLLRRELEDRVLKGKRVRLRTGSRSHFCTKTTRMPVRAGAEDHYLRRMPSQLHESLLMLFRNQPALAPELIRGALGGDLPPYRSARVVAADLSEIQPAEYRADLVVELLEDGVAHGLIVEVQLSLDDHKEFAWPAYVATLRRRMKRPTSLLVVTANNAVARWARAGFRIDALNHFTPYVLALGAVPEVVNAEAAQRDPEFAVLSALAHGRDADVSRALEIALTARRVSMTLDADRSQIYCDLILSHLGEAARRALKKMDIDTYEFQSDFARKYFARGEARGRDEGRAEMILELLRERFGEDATRSEVYLASASSEELKAIGKRLLRATRLELALGPRFLQQSKKANLPTSDR